jgi:hypothetical protein
MHNVNNIFAIMLYYTSIHGNPLKDSGIQRICKEMAQHPNIVSLDVSDCELTDQSMEVICNLLPKTGTKSGVKIRNQRLLPIVLITLLKDVCSYHL